MGKAYMLSTLIFLATLVAIAAAQEHDSALGANEALFGTDLIQDLMSAENGKQLEGALDFTSSKTSTSTWTLGLSKGTYGNTDIGQSAFNQRFWASEHHIIKRVCSSCSPDFREVYYRRYTKLDSFDIYDTIKENWDTANNVANKDFGLFSTYDNAKTWAYGWQYCDVAWNGNTDVRTCNGKISGAPCPDPGIGFPHHCGPKGPSSNQWNSWTRGGKDVAFYAEGQSPAAVPTPPPTWATWTLGLSKGTYGNTDIGQSAFNQRFWASEHHIIKRVCSSCSPEFREVYYRRYTKLDSFDIYDTIKENWDTANNVANKDFGLFSTYDNAKTWAYGWQYCDVAWNGNTDVHTCDGKISGAPCPDPGIGFPPTVVPKVPAVI